MDCMICSKKFSNGRALGVHMRTHFALLPVPPRTPQTLEQQQPILPSSSGLVVVDKEAKTGSGLNELDMGGDDDDVAAWCLIRLSRDVWRSSDDGDEIGKPVYRCERCEKVFKSSQGLGNHMKNHIKKIKNSFDNGDRVVRDDARECPFCGKSFGSGQALGGHKKSHFGASRIGSVVNDAP